MRRYTVQDVRRDGRMYVLETGQGRLSGESGADDLVRVGNELEQGKRRPALFLAAWKEAVALAGERFFDIRSASVESATDKNELAPNLDTIFDIVGVLSGGERRFLLAICQFYNDRTVYNCCDEHKITVPSLTDLALLDESRRTVLARLLQTYDGW